MNPQATALRTSIAPANSSTAFIQPSAETGLKEIPLDELGIKHLQARSDILQMAELRKQIDLAAATSVDPQFAEHEKKETN